MKPTWELIVCRECSRLYCVKHDMHFEDCPCPSVIEEVERLEVFKVYTE